MRSGDLKSFWFGRYSQIYSPLRGNIIGQGIFYFYISWAQLVLVFFEPLIKAGKSLLQPCCVLFWINILLHYSLVSICSKMRLDIHTQPQHRSHLQLNLIKWVLHNIALHCGRRCQWRLLLREKRENKKVLLLGLGYEIWDIF